MVWSILEEKNKNADLSSYSRRLLDEKRAEDDEAPHRTHLVCCEVNLLKKYTQPTFHLCAVGL